MKRITVKHGRRVALAVAVMFAISGSVQGWQAGTASKPPPSSYLPVV